MQAAGSSNLTDQFTLLEMIDENDMAKEIIGARRTQFFIVSMLFCRYKLKHSYDRY